MPSWFWGDRDVAWAFQVEHNTLLDSYLNRGVNSSPCAAVDVVASSEMLKKSAGLLNTFGDEAPAVAHDNIYT